MDIKKISKLIKLIEQSCISEIKISNGTEVVKIKKSIHAYKNTKNSEKTKIYKKNNLNKSIKNNKKNKEKKTIIKSPMVGTFYYNSHKDSKPFISINQKINKGDIIYIIEAMKVVNYIRSEKSGIIKKILVKNGKSVEFDQPLIIIE
ncbi:acetyl-CoA carboxylase biotin carboxyl carrier protein [Buchnera aphidicola (Neophyllaphis podocarpi)]|uniref:acetyl-CoA carboxylase biotin carboxyl carrier protein n=1 Tax=Buchnera aphidicola TaxID=9 RepID=UPI0031B8A12B